MPVDLNVVDSLTLIGLPGVGPWVAGRILAARRRWGGFADTSLLVRRWVGTASPGPSCRDSRASPEAVHRRCPDSLSVEEWKRCRASAVVRRRPGPVRGPSRRDSLGEVEKSGILGLHPMGRVLPYLHGVLG